MRVDLESIVRQAKEPICAEVDNEVMMMSIENGSYYALDAIGARVWELIAEPRRVVELRDLLMTEFDVDSLTCETDILGFFNKLAEENLIEAGKGGI